MFLRRIAAVVLAVSALFATPVAAFACRHPLPACARTGDLICSTPAYLAAVHQLAKQPALTLPHQWVRPDGRALVRECLSSYPNTRADRGRPNDELMTCLSERDPRYFDHRVITVHRARVLHLL